MEKFPTLHFFPHTSDFQTNKVHFIYEGVLATQKFDIKMKLPTGRPVLLSWNYFLRSGFQCFLTWVREDHKRVPKLDCDQNNRQ
jgi:hypothetical protein